MHNTGFNHLGGRFSENFYEAIDTINPKVVSEYVKDPKFGGASVTIPLKEKLWDLVDQKSDAVLAIGALNTLIPTKDGRIIADNTDWKGIMIPLKPYLPSTLVQKTKGVIVGAGGTARAAIYALKQLGYSGDRLIVCNPRTPSKGDALAREFKCESTPDIENLKEVTCVVCTLPPAAKYVAPTSILEQKPVILEAIYLPPVTPLGEAAAKFGCKSVKGLDMLIAQGLEQFELWTGVDKAEVKAPIDKAVREMYKAAYIDKSL
eukprot:CAMPEP_0197519148 /NCGR_PEP_ID=MMETSP1318-20131121/4416_1 /TAXON_ID=552666 /ORGANISM="Partenskyella glossopodia, Strain RCC365" /LENGTH=261 /DNA_ID=CAMNT_0043069965 /DNA_START=236 /DNA_END=1021 /DNA_ORIENTATION=+